MSELSLQNSRLENRYDIRNQLGRGSYAEIFTASDSLASPQSPHKIVVIKALNVFLQNDLDPDLERTLVENFQNEAIALDRVRHPNIISRLGHGTARDLRGTVFHYLVLEYLSGGDLAKSCREERLPLKKALNYLEQICAGLGHAHENGIIHRDIKPQNLLLTKDRATVKIADFGVARVSQTDSPITRVGTNIFAPPEHSPMLADDENAIVYKGLTPAADIYSLAKSAYVLFTCESPRMFANQPINALPYAFREKDWADELLKILNRATQSSPAERPQNVNDFWKDLSKLARFRDDEETGADSSTAQLKIDKVPQAHVARGYTPDAPQKPRFNTSKDLKLKNLPLSNNAPLVVKIGGNDDVLLKKYDRTLHDPIEKTSKQPPPIYEEKPAIVNAPEKPKRKKSLLRRAAVFMLALVIFAGVLYGTHTYLSGRGLLPKIFARQTGIANNDLNLRPEPNTTKDPIGFVSKNSRVRVLNSQNNWYEIEIIQQGRTLDTPNSIDRGWVNGKYLDLD